MRLPGAAVIAALVVIIPAGVASTPFTLSTARPHYSATGPGPVEMMIGAARGSLGGAGGSPHWNHLFPGSHPKGAAGAILVYDQVDRYVVYFGGHTVWACFPCHYQGETWAFLPNGTWVQLHPTFTPKYRAFAAAAYDATDGYVVMFGGQDVQCCTLNDTWTFVHGQWHQVTSAVHPMNAMQGSMAYDDAIGKIVYFGGTSTFRSPDATWTFHAGTWTKLHPSHEPPPRRLAQMTYFPRSHSILLFGGCFGGICKAVNETWAFNGTTWHNITTNTSAPAIADGSFSYDPTLRGAVLYGGDATSGAANETWIYNSSGWSQVCAGCGPHSRDFVSTTWDNATNALILFAGSGCYPKVMCHDTWEFA